MYSLLFQKKVLRKQADTLQPIMYIKYHFSKLLMILNKKSSRSGNSCKGLRQGSYSPPLFQDTLKNKKFSPILPPVISCRNFYGTFYRNVSRLIWLEIIVKKQWYEQRRKFVIFESVLKTSGVTPILKTCFPNLNLKMPTTGTLPTTDALITLIFLFLEKY